MNNKNNKSPTNKCDNKNSNNRNYENINNNQMKIKVIIIFNNSDL